MRRHLNLLSRFGAGVWSSSVAILLLSIGAAGAAAQTTVVLDVPGTQVTDTTVRGGSYANTNYASDVLVTRKSNHASLARRALIKFDTANTIPVGSSITSATLTLTVKTGGSDGARRVGAYRVTKSFVGSEATWNARNTSLDWDTAGGDLGTMYAEATVTNVAGSKVTFDLTSFVQSAVNGTFGSRYTRVALKDLDAATGASYREYYHSEATNTANRPKLVVVYGGDAPAPSTTTGTKLKVLQWNTHHGTDENGTYNLDAKATWMASFNPDLISLNEVEKFTYWGNEDQPYRYKTLMQQKTGKTWYYYFAAKSSDPGKGVLILSTYPFVSTSKYQLPYTQPVARASIIVNGRTINFMSTHFDAYSSTKRLVQAKDLVAYASGFAQQRIIAGDLNAWPDQSSIATMTATYYDAWPEADDDGTAVSYSGREDGQTRKGRIDYILYSKGATNLVLTKCQVFNTDNANGVMASDHAPVMATFDVK